MIFGNFLSVRIRDSTDKKFPKNHQGGKKDGKNN